MPKIVREGGLAGTRATDDRGDLPRLHGRAPRQLQLEQSESGGQ